MNDASTGAREWRSFAVPRRTFGITLDGRAMLVAALERSEWGGALRAVAALTVFVHRDVVDAMGDKPMFRIVRARRGNGGERGSEITKPDGRIMLDDNYSCRVAFELAAGIPRCKDISTNHIYADSNNVNLYTNPKNIALTPNFIAKLTDSQSKDHEKAERNNPCLAAVRYRAFCLYGLTRPDGTKPLRPSDYPPDRDWAEPIGKETTSAVLRERCLAYLKTQKGSDRKDRAAQSVKMCGGGWM